MADFLTYKNAAGTTIFSLDDSGNLTVAGVLASTGTDDFGTLGLKADVIAESTSGAGVTIDGLRIKDGAVTPAAGAAAFIDVSGNATGESDVILGANLASAFTFRTSALTYWNLRSSTASPGIDETWAHTGTASGHSLTETINHASQVGGGFDANVTQLTTPRTAGYAYGYRAKTTSLTGDLNGVPYAGLYVLAPTDGGGAVLHSGLYVEAGNDYSVHGLDNVRTAWGTGAAGVADATMGWDATILSLLCAVDDSVYKVGNGTLSWDVWIYGNTANDYVEWDASANELKLLGAAHIKCQTIVAGTGTAIPVTHSGSFPITQNGAETNTLADPTFIGQWLSIFVDTDTSGARVITAASRINQAANTVITLTEVGDFIKLEAITIAGALKWQVVANDGAVLS